MKQDMRELGRAGGRATASRYGRQHMQEIGRKGFAAMVEKHWNGNRRRAVQRLAELGRMSMDAVPENGAWQKPRKDGEPW